MNRYQNTELSNFFVTGINYKKTDTKIRGSFAVGPEQYERILTRAPQFDVRDLFVLSTCNRTEIYGIAENAEQLLKLLCTETQGTADTFSELSYRKNGVDAVIHLFDVSAGLDSQILGDYEIVGQLRKAMKFAKEKGFIHSFLDRTLNQVLQSSKEIKNNTSLSDGTVSVAFAAVQYIREKSDSLQDKRILLLGTGKIGTVTCKNLVDYLPASQITLMNRSPEKAESLALAFNLKTAPFSDLQKEINLADVVLVATDAPEPVILASSLENNTRKKIIIGPFHPLQRGKKK